LAQDNELYVLAKSKDRKAKERAIRKYKLRKYLLRTNLTESKPDVVWQRYFLLTQVEAAFKSLKSDLAVRPVYHQLEHRVEAHIFLAFLAYCLIVTLRQKLRYYAPGLTARDVLDKLSAIVMIDVRIPTTDSRMLEMRRYSQPELEHRIILDKLKVRLPKQPPPKVYSHQLKR
jgi:hypothetical protein